MVLQCHPMGWAVRSGRTPDEELPVWLTGDSPLLGVSQDDL